MSFMSLPRFAARFDASLALTFARSTIGMMSGFTVIGYSAGDETEVSGGCAKRLGSQALGVRSMKRTT